jgi:hypothetical protein
MGKYIANTLTTTFCRECKKLRSCYYTMDVAEHRYLCKECASDYIDSCKDCGREGVKDLFKGGYCDHCVDNNLGECKHCGTEEYKHNMEDGICYKCQSGTNKPCIKCNDYFNAEDLHEGLCDKCRIKVFRRKQKQKVDEVSECMECGREQHINQMENGLCMFCYKEGEIMKLKNEMKKIKKRVYA